MRKIKPIKPKLGRRIVAAIRALKGEPWPAEIVSTPLKIERHNIQSFGISHVTGRYFDEWAPEGMDEVIRKHLAADLGRALLEAGAIEITAEPADPQKHDLFAGTVYRAKIRVAMPEKEVTT